MKAGILTTTFPLKIWTGKPEFFKNKNQFICKAQIKSHTTEHKEEQEHVSLSGSQKPNCASDH